MMAITTHTGRKGSTFVPTTVDMRTSKLLGWAQSPDGVSCIQVWWSPRGNRAGYSVVRANLAGEGVTTVYRRTTEEAARDRANLLWLTDKYGETEAQYRMYGN